MMAAGLVRSSFTQAGAPIAVFATGTWTGAGGGSHTQGLSFAPTFIIVYKHTTPVSSVFMKSSADTGNNCMAIAAAGIAYGAATTFSIAGAGFTISEDDLGVDYTYTVWGLA